MNGTEAVFMKLAAEGWFEIDEEGQVWRSSGERAEKRSRYNQVMFKDPDGKWRYVNVHRVVYLKHRGDIPDGMEINHKDGDKHNNRPDNLECVTPRENTLHATRVLGKNRGEQHGRASLTKADIREIRRLAAKGVDKKDIAAMRGTTVSNVHHIVARRTWKHV